jgi:type II secretory pathway pseudopilin PulG
MRRGFSLITALVFMILVATLGALALSLSTSSVKQTSDLYLREQAELLALSATEYALLAISAHNFTANCLNTINSTYTQDGTTTLFDINITLYYLGNGLPANCMKPSGQDANISSNIVTNDSNRTVIIDTIVSSANGIASEPIRYHRRTIQKP